MKVVMLIESSGSSFSQFQELSKDKKQFLLDVGDCKGETEYLRILNGIEKFSKSDSEIMLTKFSGKEDIIQQVGDESPEMILSLSSNRRSKYYVEEPEKLFLDLLTIFERGD